MNENGGHNHTPETSPEAGKTLALLCRDLGDLERGLDLAEIEQSLREADPPVQVEIVEDLCHRPQVLSEMDGRDARRVVLGVCTPNESESELQYHARKAGFDPLGVESVGLRPSRSMSHPRRLATGRATVLLAAAVARARAFPGSSPESVKSRLLRSRQKVSRRALFTLPPVRYQPVAVIRGERCLSEAGCDLCAAACPRDALTAVDGRMAVDKSACDPCGRCTAACPRDAIALATASPAQLEAELTALLRAPGLPESEPRAVLFLCDRNTGAFDRLPKEGVPYPAGWLPLRVPCAGMISPGWVLQSLALGASKVGVMGCARTCSSDQYERVEGVVDYSRKLVNMLGGEPQSVRIVPATPSTDLAAALSVPLAPRPEPPASARATLREPAATVQAIECLAKARGDRSEPLSLTHTYTPLGIVSIDAAACTGCEACSRACPTEALASRQEDGGLALAFDPALCTGCELCARWCPEDIVRVERITDVEALRRGEALLYEDTEVRCERCGAPFAPAAMLRRVEDLLQKGAGTDGAPPAAFLRRCPSCRGIGLGAPSGQS